MSESAKIKCITCNDTGTVTDKRFTFAGRTCSCEAGQRILAAVAHEETVTLHPYVDPEDDWHENYGVPIFKGTASFDGEITDYGQEPVGYA